LQCEQTRSRPDQDERENVIPARLEESTPGKFAVDENIGPEIRGSGPQLQRGWFALPKQIAQILREAA
jgi:hypothetical protein